MKQLLPLILFIATALGVQAQSNVKISGLTPSSTPVSDADIYISNQSGTTYSVTAAQLKAYALGGGSAAIASGKTFTLNNSLQFSGTDGSTVNFGAGGTVIYSLGIGSSTEAWSAKLDALSALATTGTNAFVLSQNTDGSLHWIAQSGLGSLVFGSHANGIVSLSGTTFDFVNAVNTANGLSQLDGSGWLPAGELGNYINKSSGVQAYTTQLATLGGATNPFTAILPITFNGTWPSISIGVTTGTTSSTVAIGNDARFPASVNGLRKGAGAGNSDTAAVHGTDYIAPSDLGAGVQSAAANAANGPNALDVRDGFSNVSAPTYYAIGTTSTVGPVVFVGDSIVSGGPALTSSQQTIGGQFSPMGFALASTVYDCGVSGDTSHSIAADYNVSKSYVSHVATNPNALAAISTSPHAILNGSTNGWCVYVISGSDYAGVMLNATISSSSTTITGLSRTYYFTDTDGYTKAIAIGDGVSGDGIPAGTTVATVTPAFTLSATPTKSETTLLTFTPNVGAGSMLATSIASLGASAHADGAKFAVVTVQPANNTVGGLVDGQTGQGYFQANRLAANAYVMSLTIGGGGGNPDIKIIDAANDPQFQSFNALLMGPDLLHPIVGGNFVYAKDINGALLATLSNAPTTSPLAANGTQRGTLPAATAFTDTSLTMTSPMTIAGGLNTNGTVNINPGTDGGAGQEPGDLLINSTVGGVRPALDIHTDATQSGTFWIGIGTAKTQIFYVEGATSGQTIIGDTTRTGNLKLQTAGPEILYNTSLINSYTSSTTNGGLSYGWYVNSNHYNTGVGTGPASGARIMLGGFSSAGVGIGCNWGIDDGVFIQPLTSGKNIYLGNSAGTAQFEVSTSGAAAILTVGQTVTIKGGSNAASGSITLSSGAGTISSTAITAKSALLLTQTASSGASTYPQISVVDGTATITGASTDNGTYNWGLIQVNQ